MGRALFCLAPLFSQVCKVVFSFVLDLYHLLIGRSVKVNPRESVVVKSGKDRSYIV